MIRLAPHVPTEARDRNPMSQGIILTEIASSQDGGRPFSLLPVFQFFPVPSTGVTLAGSQLITEVTFSESQLLYYEAEYRSMDF